ncbi:sensor histidine kinase [Paenibacillus sp. PAMC21692]|uniref:sensor histidine kinase n=1 Tax=Paenibacillus sp. PAMC21692 TaxID=2762320 RepID=UPI00164DE51F|nr:sensor histidine kinase [Paenibacillus sp. PAMC21692]QNK58943.1 sensor histidine kinase [Paenibacillus sp. PAMC21692]
MFASLFVISYYSNHISTKAIIQKAQINSSRELSLITNHLNTLISTINNSGVSLSIDYRMQALLNDNPTVPESLSAKNSLNIEFQRIIYSTLTLRSKIKTTEIVSADYSIFQTSEFDPETVKGIVKREASDYIDNIKSAYWMGLYRIPIVSGEMQNVFLITKPVINMNTGLTLGSILLFINEEEIASIYSMNIADNNVQYDIVNADNQIVSSTNKDRLYRNFLSEHSMAEQDFNQLTSTGRKLQGRNDDRLLYTVQNFDALNWKIISVVPLQEITQEVRDINKLIIFISVICLILSLLVSYILSRLITKPIIQLHKSMKAIRNGDLLARTNVTSTDEIGLLSNGFNTLMDQINELMEEIYTAQQAKRKYEFKIIQSQLNPHFLYNSLETINSLIQLKLNDSAMKFTNHLSNFYRISLSSGNDVILISEEIRIIESYLFMQSLRYHEFMDYVIEVDDSIFPCKIPKLTLQPLVENAIYHGLRNKRDKGLVTITGRLMKEFILLEITDNGIGMSEHKINDILTQDKNSNKLANFGITSVNERIKLLFGEAYGLTFMSEVGSYTKVIVKIPIGKEDEFYDV